MKEISFYRDIINKIVVDKNGEKVGKIHDFSVIMGEEFPSISNLIMVLKKTIGQSGKLNIFKHTEITDVVIPWPQIGNINEVAIYLKVSKEEIVPTQLKENELLLHRDIMDQQIVDNKGQRILRVNDIRLKELDGKLVLVGVEVGLHGILVRLSQEKGIEALINLFRKKVVDNIIMWDKVEEFDQKMHQLKLNISQEMVKYLYNL
jgi:sporulation protein YlmC with PRC-barrel domain